MGPVTPCRLGGFDGMVDTWMLASSRIPTACTSGWTGSPRPKVSAQVAGIASRPQADQGLRSHRRQGVLRHLQGHRREVCRADPLDRPPQQSASTAARNSYATGIGSTSGGKLQGVKRWAGRPALAPLRGRPCIRESPRVTRTNADARGAQGLTTRAGQRRTGPAVLLPPMAWLVAAYLRIACPAGFGVLEHQFSLRGGAELHHH